MPASAMPRTSPRSNQHLRTRKDLLLAAGRLLKEGRQPTMDEIAAAALVSRATAYRYFPTLEAQLIEAPLDGAMPDPDRLFADVPSTDPDEAFAGLVAAFARRVDAGEAPATAWRSTLASLAVDPA